jgi:hypothetical protein
MAPNSPIARRAIRTLGYQYLGAARVRPKFLRRAAAVRDLEPMFSARLDKLSAC